MKITLQHIPQLLANLRTAIDSVCVDPTPMQNLWYTHSSSFDEHKALHEQRCLRKERLVLLKTGLYVRYVTHRPLILLKLLAERSAITEEIALYESMKHSSKVSKYPFAKSQDDLMIQTNAMFDAYLMYPKTSGHNEDEVVVDLRNEAWAKRSNEEIHNLLVVLSNKEALIYHL